MTLMKKPVEISPRVVDKNTSLMIQGGIGTTYGYYLA